MAERLIDGRYLVLRRVGAGGMATVFEARHTGTGKHVALKLVHDSALEGEQREVWLARFEREARAAGSIDSPHIANVFDAANDRESGQPYIAMDLLDGEDLKSLLKRLGPLPADPALRIAAQVLLGLSAAHAAGVVHRDIKPGNLFLHREKAGRISVKILDFGVAKLNDEGLVDAETAELTRTGSVIGTPHYMSPEQAQALKEVDQRSDLWSLGVVLHKMLSGRTPFDHVQSIVQIVIAICTRRADPITDRAPWVSPEVGAFIARLLELDPKKRFQTAREALDALAPLLPAGHELSAASLVPLPAELQPIASAVSSPGATTTPDSPLRRDQNATETTLETAAGVTRSREAPRRRRTLLPVVLGVAAVATAGTAIWLGSRASPDGASGTATEPLESGSRASADPTSNDSVAPVLPTPAASTSTSSVSAAPEASSRASGSRPASTLSSSSSRKPPAASSATARPNFGMTDQFE